MYLLKVIIIALMFTSLKSSPSISGFVRDISNGEPISYANVFISNSTIGSTTNRDGYFALSDLQVGKYELNVTMIGFASYKDSVELLTDESVRLDIVLRSQVLESSEILVTAERQKFQRAIESMSLIHI